MPFCGCLSMRYYQPYFDIDTQEIYSRIIASVFYCRSTTSFIATLK